MVEEESKKALGKRLESVRLKELQGISRRRLSALLRAEGVVIDNQGASIRRYEEGERDVPAVLVASLARLARINPGWLLTGVGDRYLAGEDAEKALARIRAILNSPISNENATDDDVTLGRQVLRDDLGGQERPGA